MTSCYYCEEFPPNLIHLLLAGGAQSCVSSHMGEIRPGSVRGNHRHHTCNETFVFWGADTLFRVLTS